MAVITPITPEAIPLTRLGADDVDGASEGLLDMDGANDADGLCEGA